MRALRYLTLLLLVLVLPGMALAAPKPIALADYQAMLKQGISHLERAEKTVTTAPEQTEAAIDEARPFLSGTWLVQGPIGTVEADLTPIARLLNAAGPELTQPRANLSRALALARDHLAASEALVTAQPITAPEARGVLEKALEETQARSLLQRIQEWFMRTFLRPAADGAAHTFVAQPWVYWVGGAIAFAALLWMGLSLYRSLSGHGAGREAVLGGGRADRLDRPATPGELRQRARQLAEGGMHLEGLRTAHLALLKQYDTVGLIRFVPAQTNREHERQLRQKAPDLAKQFRSLNDLVDDRLYSGQGASIEDFLTVDSLVDQLWREGDAKSKSADATPGR